MGHRQKMQSSIVDSENFITVKIQRRNVSLDVSILCRISETEIAILGRKCQ